MIRLFLALPLSEEEAGGLWNSLEASRFSSSRIRWIPADQYHVTLLFFGNLEQADVPVICSVMDQVSGLFAPFHLSSDGPGQFPVKGTPRVFVERLREQGLSSDRQLASLQHLLYLKLKDHYKLEHRKFRPHITTARIRHGSGKAAVLNPPVYSVSGSLAFRLENLVLFESILKPDGPWYNPLYNVKFEG